MRNNTIKTAIVDKNGKATYVHRNDDDRTNLRGSAPSRLTKLKSPPPPKVAGSGWQEISVSLQPLKVGLANRAQLERSFKQLEKAGCTVEYKEKRGLLSSEYTDITVTGASLPVNRWEHWVANNDGETEY